MPERTLDELYTIASRAVDRARTIFRTRGRGAITMKSDRDPVTELDRTIEREVRRFLRSATPEIGFLGEEGGRSGPDDSRSWWALDPIDGTMNAAHDLPLCAISLALIQDFTPNVGVIDLPFSDDRYYAIRGQGAYRDDDQELRVSSYDSLGDALIAVGDYAVGDGADVRNEARHALVQHLARSAARVRMIGSAAIDLAWVAEGRLGASITLSNKPWDMSAGVLLASEAGATVLDQHGRAHDANSDSTIAVAPGLTQQLIGLLKQAAMEAGHADTH